MSEIKLKPTGGGAGSVSLKAPAATTGNADVPFVLPVADGSAGQYLKTDGSKNLSFGTITIPAGGLAAADNWRLTADFSGGASPITSNFERVDGTLQPSTPLGSGMSESSGVFTFPSTGYWYVQFNHYFDKDGSTRWVDAYIDVTSDNGSNWDSGVARSSSHITKRDDISWNVFGSQVTSTILDITDTSNHKVRFGTGAGSAVTTHGGSSDSETQFTFMKLGDT